MSKSITWKPNPRKERLHRIIFETDTPSGKWFDIILMITILASVVVVMLESMAKIRAEYATTLLFLEWFFTIIFTIEYALRLYCVYRPLKYATSFFGIIDLLAIIPTYLSVFIAGSQYFLIIRALRLLRVFRIFKLVNYLWQAQIILVSLRKSLPKITVFLFFTLVLVSIIGAVMYLIEGGTNESFSSIPTSMYWAIVTLTTVGYGDITPQSNIGQMLSAFVMLLGYAIIAVPTGIIATDLMSEKNPNRYKVTDQACRYCASSGHAHDAIYCKYCGEILNEE